MKDGETKRKVYLLNKATHIIVGIARAVYALAVGGIALVLIRAAVQNIGVSASNSIFFAITAAVLLAFGLYIGRRSALLIQASKTLPYVPPVHEQIATLPTDKILLGGSE